MTYKIISIIILIYIVFIFSKDNFIKMEFRIFFPIPSQNDESHFNKNNNELNEYKQVLTSLKQLIDTETINECLGIFHNNEVREDSYLIGNNHFGLKYRDQKKMEIKIRTGIHSHLKIESYKKTKLGKKKNLNKYTEEIVDLLKEENQLKDGDEVIITRTPIFLDVMKSRYKVSDERISMEICILTIKPSLLSKDSIDMNKTSRQYLSIALEGTIENIEEKFYSTNNVNIELFKQALKFLVRLSNSSLEYSLSNGFIPCIAGYPTFVRLVGKLDMKIG